MYKSHKRYFFWGKICCVFSAALIIATLASSLLPSKAVLAASQGKVYVCKYVGRPGIDERLQTGQNPIEVSVNAIPEPVVIGSYFPDKQGRSYVLGFVPMFPEPTRDNCPPPDVGNASASVTPGVCSYTEATGSLTPVTLDLHHAALTVDGATYTTSQTIFLEPDSYPYSWTALTGYTGSGTGTLVIGDCTPGPASVSVTPGVCSYTEATGSLTPVTLDLQHATLTIDGLAYTTSQTIILKPGSYPYSWTALTGYSGNGTGTIVIGDCKPGTASVSVNSGACSYTEATGSLTPVTLELHHAALIIDGSTYITSQTIILEPDSYPYSWTALAGYTGSGTGTLVIGDCKPGTASVSVTPGICSYTEATGSLTPVTLELHHAALTINAVTYINSQTINLEPDSYPYSWAAEIGYMGNGTGTLVIGDCKPGTASVSVTPGACNWTGAGSLTPVTLELQHATLTFAGATYINSQIINLAPGNYPYSWTAEAGYTGSGNDTVVIGDCTPYNANASISVGICGWTQAAGSLTPVTLELQHAALTINGATYTTSQTITLAPGSYPYNWAAETGYTGSGSGTVVIGNCGPSDASASVTVGVCGWTPATGSLTPVTLLLENAALTINGITYTTPQTITLAPGSYPYSWMAEAGYTGNGNGMVVINYCPPILMPISGVAKGWLNRILPRSLFGLSLDSFIPTSFSAPRDILNLSPAAPPTIFSDESHLYASNQGAQATGLVPDRLVISTINLDVPIIPVGFLETGSGGQVFNQWLTPDQYAAGWHVTSALLGLPGNTVLNGHHNAYGMVFKDLVKLKAGDVISVYSGFQEFRYQVAGNLLLPELYEPLSTRIENARWIGPSLDERITLVTCWPENDNTHRVVIVALPISNPDPHPSP